MAIPVQGPELDIIINAVINQAMTKVTELTDKLTYLSSNKEHEIAFKISKGALKQAKDNIASLQKLLNDTFGAERKITVANVEQYGKTIQEVIGHIAALNISVDNVTKKIKELGVAGKDVGFANKLGNMAEKTKKTEQSMAKLAKELKSINEQSASKVLNSLDPNKFVEPAEKMATALSQLDTLVKNLIASYKKLGRAQSGAVATPGTDSSPKTKNKAVKENKKQRPPESANAKTTQTKANDPMDIFGGTDNNQAAAVSKKAQAVADAVRTGTNEINKATNEAKKQTKTSSPLDIFGDVDTVKVTEKTKEVARAQSEVATATKTASNVQKQKTTTTNALTKSEEAELAVLKQIFTEIQKLNASTGNTKLTLDTSGLSKGLSFAKSVLKELDTVTQQLNNPKIDTSKAINTTKFDETIAKVKANLAEIQKPINIPIKADVAKFRANVKKIGEEILALKPLKADITTGIQELNGINKSITVNVKLHTSKESITAFLTDLQEKIAKRAALKIRVSADIASFNKSLIDSKGKIQSVKVPAEIKTSNLNESIKKLQGNIKSLRRLKIPVVLDDAKFVEEVEKQLAKLRISAIKITADASQFDKVVDSCIAKLKELRNTDIVITAQVKEQERQARAEAQATKEAEKEAKAQARAEAKAAKATKKEEDSYIKFDKYNRAKVVLPEEKMLTPGQSKGIWQNIAGYMNNGYEVKIKNKESGEETLLDEKRVMSEIQKYSLRDKAAKEGKSVETKLRDDEIKALQAERKALSAEYDRLSRSVRGYNKKTSEEKVAEALRKQQDFTAKASQWVEKANQYGIIEPKFSKEFFSEEQANKLRQSHTAYTDTNRLKKELSRIESRYNRILKDAAKLIPEAQGFEQRLKNISVDQQALIRNYKKLEPEFAKYGLANDRLGSPVLSNEQAKSLQAKHEELQTVKALKKEIKEMTKEQRKYNKEAQYLLTGNAGVGVLEKFRINQNDHLTRKQDLLNRIAGTGVDASKLTTNAFIGSDKLEALIKKAKDKASSLSNNDEAKVKNLEQRLENLQFRRTVSEQTGRLIQDRSFFVNNRMENFLINKLRELGSTKEYLKSYGGDYETYNKYASNSVFAKATDSTAKTEKLKRLQEQYNVELSKANDLMKYGTLLSQKQVDDSVRKLNNLRRQAQELGAMKEDLKASEFENLGGNAKAINNTIVERNAASWSPANYATISRGLSQLGTMREAQFNAWLADPSKKNLANLTKSATQMKRLNREAQRYARLVSDANQSHESISNKLKNHISWMTSGVMIGTIFGVPAETIATWQDLEYRMAGVAQVIPALEHGADGMTPEETTYKETQALIGIARQFGVEPGEAMEAAKSIGRMYGKGENGVKNTNLITSQAAKMAVADAFDMENAFKGLESALSQWNMQTEDTGKLLANTNKIIETWTITAHSGAASAQDIGQAIEIAGTAAANAGVSFEFFNALVATGVRQTARSGNEIGQAIKSMMVSMQSDKSLKALKQWGIDVYRVGEDGTKSMKPMEQILLEVSTLINTTDKDTRKLLMTLSGGRRGVNPSVRSIAQRLLASHSGNAA